MIFILTIADMDKLFFNAFGWLIFDDLISPIEIWREAEYMSSFDWIAQQSLIAENRDFFIACFFLSLSLSLFFSFVFPFNILIPSHSLSRLLDTQLHEIWNQCGDLSKASPLIKSDFPSWN